MYIYTYIYECMYTYSERASRVEAEIYVCTYIHIYRHICIYIYIYECIHIVSAPVALRLRCVWERERARERESEGKKESERESERVSHDWLATHEQHMSNTLATHSHTRESVRQSRHVRRHWEATPSAFWPPHQKINNKKMDQKKAREASLRSDFQRLSDRLTKKMLTKKMNKKINNTVRRHWRATFSAFLAALRGKKLSKNNKKNQQAREASLRSDFQRLSDHRAYDLRARC
jgi:hypothetical protein